MKKRIKKTAIILLAAVSLLSGCKKNEEVKETTEPVTAAVTIEKSSTIVPNVLTVGIYDLDNELINVSGDVVKGFNIDMMNEIGEMTFYEVRFVQLSSKNDYSLLDVGNFDMILADLELTPELDRVYDFSVSYVNYGDKDLRIMTKTGNNRLINALNECISIMKTRGIIDNLGIRWFPVAPTTETSTTVSQ